MEVMLLATYQSNEYIKQVQDNVGIIEPKKELGADKSLFEKNFGYVPVFCIPIFDGIKDNMDKTLFEFIKVAPHHPQKLIILETEEYDTFSYVDWANHCKYNTEKLRVNSECKDISKEYVMRGIDKRSIQQITDISDAPYDDIICGSNDHQLNHVFNGGIIQSLQQVISAYRHYEIRDFNFLPRNKHEEFADLCMKVIDIGCIEYGDMTEKDITEFYLFCTKHIIFKHGS